MNAFSYGCRVVFDNESDPVSTLITVDSANKAGCLLQVVQLLTDLDLVISKAHISSDGGWFVDGTCPPALLEQRSPQLSPALSGTRSTAM